MPGRAIRWAYVATVVVFLASLAQYYQRNTGFTTLISFGDQFEKTAPAGRHRGAALRALPVAGLRRPVLRAAGRGAAAAQPPARPALDTPSYRARRILFSWTAYALGLGRPAWILKAYAAAEHRRVAAAGVGAAAMVSALGARNVVAWIGCLFGVGLVYSFRFALLRGAGHCCSSRSRWSPSNGEPALARRRA